MDYIDYIIVAGKDKNDLKNLLEDLKEYIVKNEGNNKIDIKCDIDNFDIYLGQKKGYTQILTNYWREDKIYVVCSGTKGKEKIITYDSEEYMLEKIKNAGFTSWGIFIIKNYKEK